MSVQFQKCPPNLPFSVEPRCLALSHNFLTPHQDQENNSQRTARLSHSESLRADTPHRTSLKLLTGSGPDTRVRSTSLLQVLFPAILFPLPAPHLFFSSESHLSGIAWCPLTLPHVLSSSLAFARPASPFISGQLQRVHRSAPSQPHLSCFLSSHGPATQGSSRRF